jgi:hypothetical protein
MKNIIGLIILFVLIFVAYLLYTANGINNFVDKEKKVLKDFAIEDTASIDKVFLSQPNGKRVTISRRGFDKWMVNDKFEARPDAINLILKTVHDIKIAAPVNNKVFDAVVKRLASGATKVEYYMDGEDEPTKTWYVGDPIPNRTGTNMLLEIDGQKSSKPYVTHLLSERGFLGPRYIMDPQLWRDRLFLRIKPTEIASLEVKHDHDSLDGFKIGKTGVASFNITNLNSGEKVDLDADIAIPYLKRFSTIYYEYVDKKTTEKELDSIYNSLPRHILELKMESGETFSIRTHYLPVRKGAMVGGKVIDFHPERMYGYSSYMGEEAHPIVQNLTFDPLVPGFKDLTSSTNVEK